MLPLFFLNEFETVVDGIGVVVVVVVVVVVARVVGTVGLSISERERKEKMES